MLTKKQVSFLASFLAGQEIGIQGHSLKPNADAVVRAGFEAGRKMMLTRNTRLRKVRASEHRS